MTIRSSAILIAGLGMALSTSGCWPTVDIECVPLGRCMGRVEAPPFVFGQPDEFTNLQLTQGLNQPTHAVHAGGRLFIADFNNHRVVIKHDRSVTEAPPDIVLGQIDLSTAIMNYGGISATSLNAPHSLATDGTRLAVADSGNFRVLIWNSIPTQSHQPADVVIGQSDMTSNRPGATDRDIGANVDVAMGAGLFVIDRGNHRVLYYQNFPTQNYQPANVVIGQPNLFSSAIFHGMGMIDAGGFFYPTGPAAVTANKIFVADSNSHRVLGFSPIPTSHGADAQLVLGQATFDTGMMNRGQPTPDAGTLSNPTAVAVSGDGDKLAIADSQHRVVLYTSMLPTTNGQNANIVIGQPNFAGAIVNPGGIGAATLASPKGVSFDGADLYVADSGNSRVLHFAPPFDRQGPAATRVFGQPDFTSNLVNNRSGNPATHLSTNPTLCGGGGRLAISDVGWNRLLLFNEVPRSGGDLPALALGQPDFVSRSPGHGGGPSANGFVRLAGCWTDGTRLAVADSKRVLIWLSWPSSSLQPADLVLGQPDMTSDVANNGGVSASSLSNPTDITSDGTRLYVSDTFNHRILIWNSFPTTTQQPADLVVGQSDMTSNAGNAAGQNCYSPIAVGPHTLNCPAELTADGNVLFVADRGNYRVLQWNHLPTVNGQPADGVLGTSDINTQPQRSYPIPENISFPSGVLLAKGRLYVSDMYYHRVLYWNAIPTQNGQPADGVIGQPDLTSSLANQGGLSAQSLNDPGELFATSDRLFILDRGNRRLLALSL